MQKHSLAAIIPASLLKASAGKAALKALRIRPPTASRPIGVVTLKDRTLSPGAEVFIKTVRELARPQ